MGVVIEKVDLLVAEALRELEELTELRKRKIRERGIDFYSPNKMQLKAHQSKARTIIYSGGNRSGKSTFGVTELTFHLTRQYPKWFSEKRRFKRTIKAAISATRFGTIETVIEPKIREFLPKDYYKISRNNRYLSRIICKDGSTVDILTLEMSNEAYESADWDFVWEDEPQGQRKREGLIRGLVDRRGLEVITFTPLTEAWMKEELIDKADGKRI